MYLDMYMMSPLNCICMYLDMSVFYMNEELENKYVYVWFSKASKGVCQWYAIV